MAAPAPGGFTEDKNGDLVRKWVVDYAPRDGAGRATCRDLDCLEKYAQGNKLIEKGSLRIGRRVLMDKAKFIGEGEEPQMTIFWHHARCIFNTFRRARKGTRVITSVDDLDGFDVLRLEDQNLLRRIIEGSEDHQSARFDRNTDTPEKLQGKKRKRDEAMEERLKKGSVVWTHFRTRGKDGAEGAPVLINKSEKPELAILVDGEVRNNKLVVQFESAAHLKERVEKYNQRRFRRIRPWLKFPRLFEGPKQLVPVDWVDWVRNPPRMCSCNRQEWGHACDCEGYTCTRGYQDGPIFGVCQ